MRESRRGVVGGSFRHSRGRVLVVRKRVGRDLLLYRFKRGFLSGIAFLLPCVFLCFTFCCGGEVGGKGELAGLSH
jgi:hypothetical protein